MDLIFRLCYYGLNHNQGAKTIMNWRKHLSSYLLLMLALLIVSAIIKGVIDLFATGQLHLFHYWLLFA
jgi:hypothetical protein